MNAKTKYILFAIIYSICFSLVFTYIYTTYVNPVIIDQKVDHIPDSHRDDKLAIGSGTKATGSHSFAFGLNSRATAPYG